MTTEARRSAARRQFALKVKTMGAVVLGVNLNAGEQICGVMGCIHVAFGRVQVATDAGRSTMTLE